MVATSSGFGYGGSRDMTSVKAIVSIHFGAVFAKRGAVEALHLFNQALQSVDGALVFSDDGLEFRKLARELRPVRFTVAPKRLVQHALEQLEDKRQCRLPLALKARPQPSLEFVRHRHAAEHRSDPSALQSTASAPYLLPQGERR